MRLLKPKDKPQKRNKAALRKELDRAVKLLVFERDGHQCVRCGKTAYLHPSHVLPKGKYHNLRWELDNIKTLCLGCHLQWWHLQPTESGEWFKKTYPERWERLQIAKLTAPKPNPAELLASLRGTAEQLQTK